MNKTNIMSKEKVFPLPVISVLETHREWAASITEDADPLISFSLGPVKRSELDGVVTWEREEPLRPTVFEVREAFFSIRNPNQAVEFFQHYGPWELGSQEERAASVHFSTVLRHRETFEDALLTREIWSVRQPKDGKDMRTMLWDSYLWSNLPMELLFRSPPVAMIRCKDVKDALRASVFLDRLDGMPWRRCAREDCGKVFKRTSKREKLYCDIDCAHLQSVRSYNERKRVKAQKVKQTTRGKA